MDQLSDSRQAGATIEITPAMVEAGVMAYLAWDEASNPWLESLVIAIFQQMCREASLHCSAPTAVFGHEQSRCLGVRIQVD